MWRFKKNKKTVFGCFGCHDESFARSKRAPQFGVASAKFPPLKPTAIFVVLVSLGLNVIENMAVKRRIASPKGIFLQVIHVNYIFPFPAIRNVFAAKIWLESLKFLSGELSNPALGELTLNDEARTKSLDSRRTDAVVRF